MGEVWKDIRGYRGLYQVSDLGRVYSLGRTREIDWCGKKVIKRLKPKILKPRLAGQKGKQYLSVMLYDSKGQTKQIKVHHLVARAFCISSYFEGAIVNHKNFDKFDNRASNLEWCDYSANNAHAREKYGWVNPSGKGEAHAKAKVTETQVREMRLAHLKGETIGKLKEKYGLSYSGCRSIIFRKNWTHI